MDKRFSRSLILIRRSNLSKHMKFVSTNKRGLTALFLLNLYNDIDHTAPLILELLENGWSVRTICLTRFDIFSDLRIRHFQTFPNFRIHKLQLLPRSAASSNKTTAGLTTGRKIFRELLFNVFWAAVFLRVYKIDFLICPWGRPLAKGIQRRLVQAAKTLDIPTVCLPHGQNIYINYDVNTDISARFKETGSWPDFSDRNQFTKYAVQTIRHQEQLIAWGMNKTRVVVWGSLRFDPNWIKQNSLFYRDASKRYETSSKYSKRIVFFLPHWRYNVMEENVLELLIQILETFDDCFMVIKGHTRGDRISDRDYARLRQFPNVDINCDSESTVLIEWSDIVINFGSSIAIEAIVKNKLTIYPSYLHTNKTIFDDSPVVIECLSRDEVLTALAEEHSGTGPKDSLRLSQFLSEQVYGGGASGSTVATRYRQELVQLTTFKSQSTRHF